MILAVAIPFLAFGRPSAIVVDRRSHGAWVLTISRHTFTKEVDCALKSRNVHLEGGALVFQLGKSVDTSQAWIKIGDGDPRSWRELIPELRQMGVRLRFDDLENPSQGRVAVPLSLLVDETKIWIAADAKARPQQFMIAGLSTILERARDEGCFPEIVQPSY